MQETLTTTIKPSNSRVNFDLKDIWAYRELLYFLTLRDIKVRYKQTAIGVVWAVLQPVLTTAIFTVLFSNFARFDTGEVPYPLFALSGLLIWLFLNTAVNMASNSLTANTNLVTKVYFPRLIVPMAAVFSGLIDLLLGLLILVGMMIYYGIIPTWQLCFAPLFIALAIVLTVSFGILFAALNVRFRDVKFALPFALQVWMFISPIFYPSNMLSGKWRIAFAFNPLTGILEGFRSSLFGGKFDWTAIGISFGITVISVFFALYVFKQMEDDFADLI